MKTLLYRIPDRYFKGVTVKVPFHSKIRYEVVNGKVKIMEVSFSPDCLRFISNTLGLIEQMQAELTDAERNSHVNPIIKETLSPFIK